MLPILPQLPRDAAGLADRLSQLLPRFAVQLNSLSAGHIAGCDGRGSAAPTTGLAAQGDFVRNSEPSEAGAAGSKYVVLGWVCVAGGEPGTWKACRCLTGG